MKKTKIIKELKTFFKTIGYTTWKDHNSGVIANMPGELKFHLGTDNFERLYKVLQKCDTK